MQRAIEKTTNSLENFQIRKALQCCFFDVLNDLAWYSRRCEPNSGILKKFAESWVRLMAPFTPFVCEELWSRMNKVGCVSLAKYPEVDESLLAEGINEREVMIRNLLEDIQNILGVTKIKPKNIYIYPAPEWKRDVFKAIKDGKAISDVMKDPELRKHGKEVARMMQMRRDEIPDIILSSDEEHTTLTEAVRFMGKEFQCKINIQKDITHDPEKKARYALPMKPGIYIEG